MMEGDGVMSAHQGKEVQLECRANGDDPISIMWRREGQELLAEPGRSSITVIREIQHVTSKFSIYKTQKGDSGRYECQASNPFGKSFYQIHLQIWGKIRIFTQYNYSHSTLHIALLLTSDLFHIWRGSVLALSEVYYEIVTEGAVCANMFVIIAEPPNSPDNLTILSVTSRTARISWSISRAEPKIERFVVQWKRQDGNTSCSFSLNNDMNHNGWMS